MIVYGLLFLLIVAAALYSLARMVLWLRDPNREDIAKPAGRLFGLAVVAWLMAFSLPFVAELLGNGADTVVALAWLLSLIGVTVLAARSVQGVWGPIAGGTVMAGAVWAAAVGIYVMHSVGWQGLSLDDLDADSSGTARVWVGALFFAPGAFLLGFLLGAVSPHIIWRRPAAQ